MSPAELGPVAFLFVRLALYVATIGGFFVAFATLLMAAISAVSTGGFGDLGTWTVALVGAAVGYGSLRGLKRMQRRAAPRGSGE